MKLEQLLYLQQTYPGIIYEHVNNNIVDKILDSTFGIVPLYSKPGAFAVICYYDIGGGRSSYCALTRGIDMELAEEILQHIKDTEVLFV